MPSVAPSLSPAAKGTESPQANQNEPEDDYMTMEIQENLSTQPETFQQRRLRQKREAEDRARPKSKAELARDADKAREKGLATVVGNDSKGAQMMAKLGYKPGAPLGAPGNVHARAEPIVMELKEGKEGIGALNEKKRKFREEAEQKDQSEKKMKEDEEDYRVRVAKEREDKRAEGQWWGAMKVLQGLEEEEKTKDGGAAPMETRMRQRRTRDVPMLCRPLVADRRDREKEGQRRHDMLQSLSRNPTYDDPEEDAHDRQALGCEVEDESDGDEEDEELLGYMRLPASERVTKVSTELRETWHYCFWCKHRYKDSTELKNECPGETEDEHG